ncbi:hypothetical protein PGT21_007244 [Puccinia graminis f. sp. tritici]|uniref:Uncharacterized protein n=1 Tax=Puccinia graminis f. sp. tritici TaxID=56615 RepID=A0A5B0NV96_PUCGR|nr:hypothetical protein PGT21_007244 [Puccinia graminis f. sp. tritici]KAA1093659.1 hypothetical protein PGTUg99_017500 [Puccinia graminis f. sp. tritici]
MRSCFAPPFKERRSALPPTLKEESVHEFALFGVLILLFELGDGIGLYDSTGPSDPIVFLSIHKLGLCVVDALQRAISTCPSTAIHPWLFRHKH